MLSSALTASLRVPLDERPRFIAQTLRGEPPVVSIPVKEPDDLDAEIDILVELLKEAVNSACRRPQVEPIESIIMFLLRVDGDDSQEEPVYAPPDPCDTPEQAAARRRPPRSIREFRSLLGIRAKSAAGARPKQTMGRTASVVFPTVLGAFQEQAAKRAAKEVDERVIAEAIEAHELAMEEARKAEAVESVAAVARLDKAQPKGLPLSM